MRDVKNQKRHPFAETASKVLGAVSSVLLVKSLLRNKIVEVYSIAGCWGLGRLPSVDVWIGP